MLSLSRRNPQKVSLNTRSGGNQLPNGMRLGLSFPTIPREALASEGHSSSRQRIPLEKTVGSRNRFQSWVANLFISTPSERPRKSSHRTAVLWQELSGWTHSVKPCRLQFLKGRKRLQDSCRWRSQNIPWTQKPPPTAGLESKGLTEFLPVQLRRSSNYIFNGHPKEHVNGVKSNLKRRQRPPLEKSD